MMSTSSARIRILLALTAAIAAALCTAATASDLPTRTEKQERDLLSRLGGRPAPHRWFARQQPSTGFCNGVVPTSDSICCPEDKVYNLACAGTTYCCDGTIYGVAASACCPSGGTVFDTRLQGDNFVTTVCCANAAQLTDPDSEGSQTCCPVNQAPNGPVCENRALSKRNSLPGEKPGMTKRDGSAHTLLSAKLVAAHLTQNGRFHHEGEEYIDEEHRQLNDNVFRTLLGKGITGGLRYYLRADKKTFADTIDSVFHVPLTSTYEFAVEDVPEIYARIVSDPVFVSFKWNGMTFDREILQKLAAGHPKYSEEPVARYAQEGNTSKSASA